MENIKCVIIMELLNAIYAFGLFINYTHSFRINISSFPLQKIIHSF